MKWHRKFVKKLTVIANKVLIFSYYLYGTDHPLVEGDPDWYAPLLLDRPGVATTVPSVSYGEYFLSVQSFLAADNGAGLLGALSMHLARKVVWADIGKIHIFIQKHGAFYHPARVIVLIGTATIAFVVNVAISARGQAGLRQEFDNLDRLNQTFSRRYIPLVYHQGVGCTPGNCRCFPMFLGEWLSAYHEFHVGICENHALPAAIQFIQLWDDEKKQLCTPAQKTLVYRRAAEVLTYYYNPETFEQIFPWHHGAGDFVVRLKNDDLDLRLITVRGYAPLVDADPADPISVLDALLRFFLHLSFRMRIDREDGTGDLVWLDKTAVEGSISGFFDGLRQKPGMPVLAESLETVMEYYFLKLTLADITTALNGILMAYPPQSPERNLMALHLDTHARALKDQMVKHLALL